MTIATATLLMANPVFGSGVHIYAYQLLIGVQEMAEGILADPNGFLGEATEDAIANFLFNYYQYLEEEVQRAWGNPLKPDALPLLREVPALDE